MIASPDSGTAHPAGPLDAKAWETALQQFCHASGLTASLFDASGHRQVGPFLCASLSEFLSSAGFWEPGGGGDAQDQRLVRQVLESGQQASDHFHGAMRVDALPLVLEERVTGVVVFGWVFDHFSDPLECERLARVIGTRGHLLWSHVRLQRPTSTRTFEVAGDLLRTLIASNLTQLEAIARLQELARVREEFLASVSHELRTPLQSIRLRLEQLLRSRLDDPENVRRLLQAMKRSVDAETRLVEDLLDASRTATGKLQIELVPVRLSAVIGEALEASEPAATAKGITLEVNPARLLPGEVLGDPARLRQVLWNLLVNALKFTPTGGRVRVGLREHPGHVEVSVADTGVGISKEFLPRVFAPFAQGTTIDDEHRRSGLGLGLSIARHIVELHGGTIHAHSDGPGTGATFTFKLPRPGMAAVR